MTAHLKSHPINSTSDHSAGTARSLLGTNVAGSALAELLYDNGGTTNVGEVPVRVTGGDVLVPTTPGQAQAAASKAYVDAVQQGLDTKASARAATTAALPSVTYANGTAGVGATLTATANGALAAQDGVTLIGGDRLLVKNQVAGLQNGIYTVTTVGTGGTPFVLTRATDNDSSTSTPPKVSPGNYVSIEEGTTQAGIGFQMITAAPITMGTTSLTWTQFNGAGSLSASDGISVASNKVSTKPATAAAAQQYGGLVNNRTSDGSAAAGADAGFNAAQTDNTTLEVSATNQLRTKIFRGIGTYAGASPVYSELNTLLPAVHQSAYFESAGSPSTSSVFHCYRRGTGTSTVADFAIVEMS